MDDCVSSSLKENITIQVMCSSSNFLGHSTSNLSPNLRTWGCKL